MSSMIAVMITVKQIIQKAGGVYAVSQKLSLSQVTIYQWQSRRAIPEKYWLELSEFTDLPIDVIGSAASRIKA